MQVKITATMLMKIKRKTNNNKKTENRPPGEKEWIHTILGNEYEK